MKHLQLFSDHERLPFLIIFFLQFSTFEQGVAMIGRGVLPLPICLNFATVDVYNIYYTYIYIVTKGKFGFR